MYLINHRPWTQCLHYGLFQQFARYGRARLGKFTSFHELSSVPSSSQIHELSSVPSSSQIGELSSVPSSSQFVNSVQFPVHGSRLKSVRSQFIELKVSSKSVRLDRDRIYK